MADTPSASWIRTIPRAATRSFAEFLAHREEVLPWIKEYSPIEHASADDPPIYLIYRAAPALGQEQLDPTHTANYGVKLQEKLRSLGVECELVHPGAPDVTHKTIDAFPRREAEEIALA
jgi:hypothetical protein